MVPFYHKVGVKIFNTNIFYKNIIYNINRTAFLEFHTYNHDNQLIFYLFRTKNIILKKSLNFLYQITPHRGP